MTRPREAAIEAARQGIRCVRFSDLLHPGTMGTYTGLDGEQADELLARWDEIDWADPDIDAIHGVLGVGNLLVNGIPPSDEMWPKWFS